MKLLFGYISYINVSLSDIKTTENMRINLIPEKEILDFEKEIGFELEVNERPLSPHNKIVIHKYYAQFENSEVMLGGCLFGAYGNGNTIDDAIRDYCKQVSNCRIVFNSYTPNRKEIQFPKLIHTK